MAETRITRRRTNFTSISNIALKDSKLSLKAKGLYSLINYYLSIPDFVLYKTTLMKDCVEGRDSFNSTWKELKDAGYLVQHKIQTSEGFTYEYELLDEPNQADSPTYGFSTPGKPTSGQPTPGKPVPIINTDLNNTKQNKNYLNNVVVNNKRAGVYLKQVGSLAEQYGFALSDYSDIVTSDKNQMTGKYRYSIQDLLTDTFISRCRLYDIYKSEHSAKVIELSDIIARAVELLEDKEISLLDSNCLNETVNILFKKITDNTYIENPLGYCVGIIRNLLYRSEENKH